MALRTNEWEGGMICCPDYPGLRPISANLATRYKIHLKPPFARRFRQDMSDLRPIGYNFLNWDKWNYCLVEYSHNKIKFAPLTMIATL